jgi:hypothetical protein
MARDNEEKFLQWALQGHTAAVMLCQRVFKVSQILDDLIDKDKPVSDEDIYKAFFNAMVSIPLNAFYQQHQVYLVPLFNQYLTDWYDATLMERQGDNHFRNVSFATRSNVGSIIGQCAFLIGGLDWQREVSVRVREHIHEDTLEQYKEELS